MAAAPSKQTVIDPAALMRIKSLQLRAKSVVEGFLSGLHRSPMHGFSVEFTEYREYTSGDDLRFLDWRLYARSDRCYIKQFEDETNVRCHLLLDNSRSMGYGSLDWSKADYARTLTATLAYFLSLQRDGAGLLVFDEQVSDWLPARFRPGHLRRLLLALERAPAGKSTNLSVPLERVAQLALRRGMVVLISDLLAPIESLDVQLGALRARGHEVVVFRILDPTETTFQFERPSSFLDLESGRQIYVDPEAARAQYLERFNEHAEAVNEICMGQGIDLYTLSADQPLEMALFDFLAARLRRGRQVRRRGRAAR